MGAEWNMNTLSKVQTGIYSFSTSSVGVATPPGAKDAGEVSWGYTLYQNGTSLQSSLWYSTGGLDYADDFSLGYDVCAIQLQNTTLLTAYRGSNDTSGSCLAAFNQDQECIDALNTMATESANELVQNPTPTNLTDGSLRTVCRDIATTFQNNFPTQCTKYWNTPNVGSVVLTDHNNKSASPAGDLLTDGCRINGTDDSLNPYYSAGVSVWTNPQGYSTYDALAYYPIPMLTVFMPVANSQRPGGITGSFSQLSCLHIDHINTGSRARPFVPQPKVISGLSGGDIAGIVVGSVAGVGLLAGLAFWFWRRLRRNARKSMSVGDMRDASHSEGGFDYYKVQILPPAYNVDTETLVSELSPESERRPELPTSRSHQKYELPDTQRQEPVELSPESKQS